VLHLGATYASKKPLFVSQPPKIQGGLAQPSDGGHEDRQGLGLKIRHKNNYAMPSSAAFALVQQVHGCVYLTLIKNANITGF